MATSVMSVATNQSNVRMQSTARISMQPAARPCSLSRFASGSRLYTTTSLGRFPQQKRQITTMAENPISKAAEGVQKAAKDFGKEIDSNAEGTSEKTESAYQAANPEDDKEKPPTEEYRSTKLKNSDEKYTPKSDPKK